MTKPNFTYLAVVLDRSGSMHAVRDATIEGFNAFLEKQKEEPGEAKVTFVQFDDHVETLYANADLLSVKPLDRTSYSPLGGTALLDAIGFTIDTVGKQLAAMPEEERPSKVVVVVQTDGDENTSRTYNRNQVFDLITQQREKYSWEFVFLGANQDAIASATRLGMSGHSALSYNADPLSTGKAFSVAGSSINSYRAGRTVGATYTADIRRSVVDSTVSLDQLNAQVDAEEETEEETTP